ncbi:hypothetical protein R1flu_021609 [Riccia fluitans]|uniref:Uncharacterized protein n=1 Tax=Riccia fluitans TaxID=41844 RepID=A0ABD1ZRW0_9MARC
MGCGSKCRRKKQAAKNMQQGKGSKARSLARNQAQCADSEEQAEEIAIAEPMRNLRTTLAITYHVLEKHIDLTRAGERIADRGSV